MQPARGSAGRSTSLGNRDGTGSLRRTLTTLDRLTERNINPYVVRRRGQCVRGPARSTVVRIMPEAQRVRDGPGVIGAGIVTIAPLKVWQPGRAPRVGVTHAVPVGAVGTTVLTPSAEAVDGSGLERTVRYR